MLIIRESPEKLTQNNWTSSTGLSVLLKYVPQYQKRTIGHLRLTLAQVDLNFYWAYFGQPKLQSFFLRTMKTLIRLRGCSGWFVSTWGAYVRKYGSYIQFIKYRIRPNYRTFPYKHTIKPFRSLQITSSVLFDYFIIKVYVEGTHLNCIDLSMQFKWVPTTNVFKKKIRNK